MSWEYVGVTTADGADKTASSQSVAVADIKVSRIVVGLR